MFLQVPVLSAWLTSANPRTLCSIRSSISECFVTTFIGLPIFSPTHSSNFNPAFSIPLAVGNFNYFPSFLHPFLHNLHFKHPISDPVLRTRLVEVVVIDNCTCNVVYVHFVHIHSLIITFVVVLHHYHYILHLHVYRYRIHVVVRTGYKRPRISAS